MTRRTKILIAITAIVVIIMVVVVYLLMKNRPLQNRPATDAIANTPQTVSNNGTNVPANLVPAATPFAGAEATARSFAERFGSFSSESNFQNIADLYVVMTPTMKAWADTYIAAERAARAGQTEFYGVTSRAVKTEIIERSGSSLRLRVTTQRIETKGTSEPRSFYQPMEVALKQFGQAYFVDGAWWK